MGTCASLKEYSAGIEETWDLAQATIQTKEVSQSMQLRTLLICAGLSGAACYSQDPGLLGSIVTPDRAVSTTNQTLTGAWSSLGRRAGPPGMPNPPPAPVFFAFHSDGTLTGGGAASDSALIGVWMRVADRKFLVTYFAINYNEARAIVSIAKIRMTTQMDSEGRMLQGNQEVLVVDPEGKVLFTALGGTHAMVRLTVEKPADFDAFLAKE